MVTRRFAIAAAGASLVRVGPAAARADGRVDFKPDVLQVETNKFTAIDAVDMDTFYKDVTKYLWNDPDPLFNCLFSIDCRMIHPYSQIDGFGYKIPFSEEIYPALMLSRSEAGDFFVATEQRPRDFRGSGTLRVRGYYRGTLAFERPTNSQYGPDFSGTIVETLPLIAAIEVEEL